MQPITMKTWRDASEEITLHAFDMRGEEGFNAKHMQQCCYFVGISVKHINVNEPLFDRPTITAIVDERIHLDEGHIEEFIKSKHDQFELPDLVHLNNAKNRLEDLRAYREYMEYGAIVFDNWGTEDWKFPVRLKRSAEVAELEPLSIDTACRKLEFGDAPKRLKLVFEGTIEIQTGQESAVI